MWAVARVDAGLSDVEFDRLSLRHYGALTDRIMAGRRHADNRAGVIASTVYNLLAAKGPRLTAADFFPGLKPPPQTVEQQIAIVEALNLAFGGDDLRKGA